MAILTSSQFYSNLNNLFPPSPTTTTTTTTTSFFPHSPFRNRQFRSSKRRLKKRKFKTVLLNDLNSSSPFDFLSILPLDWVPPAALGFASALAISLSNRKASNQNQNQNRNRNSKVSDVGEWILFSSTTPFNRFVFLRCPSISFHDMAEKLVTEEKHYVRLDSGRILVSVDDEGGGGGEVVEYQRECVRTDDGGVISLDWPANLDLREERGLDTTVLVVPGTAEGSMDEDVRCFVRKCVKRGLFPVVMNPRGCAGSPLTTPRCVVDHFFIDVTFIDVFLI